MVVDPDVNLEKGLPNVKNDEWQNLKTHVSTIKEFTHGVYCKCTTTWVYLYMDA